jgi:hypothetical protein
MVVIRLDSRYALEMKTLKLVYCIMRFHTLPGR